MKGLKEKFQRFMIGRYGYDQLNQFLVLVILALWLVSALIRHRIPSGFLGALELVLMVLVYLRIFSRNTGKRFQENQTFLGLFYHVAGRWKRMISHFGRSREYRFFKCPGCGQKIRIPRGRGKVSIHCPKCGKDFIKKT